MKLRQLEFDVVKKIYEEHLCNDFVPAEQKPLMVLHILMKMGLYRCYGLYEEDTIKGYAFLCTAKEKGAKVALLDYFVILNGMRGEGLGSKFLGLIKEEYKDYDLIIGEVERVEAAENEEDRKIREKRKAFYLRNGLTITNLSVDLFGEDLQIYVLPIQRMLEDKLIFDELNQIYDKMFYEKEIRQKVILSKSME